MSNTFSFPFLVFERYILKKNSLQPILIYIQPHVCLLTWVICQSFINEVYAKLWKPGLEIHCIIHLNKVESQIHKEDLFKIKIPVNTCNADFLTTIWTAENV